MAGVVAGPMTVTWGTTQLQVTGDHTWNLGKMKREEVLGPKGEFHGFKETPQMGVISGDIVLTTAFNPLLEGFLGATDAEVVIKLPNGGTFTLTEAFQSGDGEASTENGTLKYEFKGVGKIA